MTKKAKEEHEPIYLSQHWAHAKRHVDEIVECTKMERVPDFIYISTTSIRGGAAAVDVDKLKGTNLLDRECMVRYLKEIYTTVDTELALTLFVRDGFKKACPLELYPVCKMLSRFHTENITLIVKMETSYMDAFMRELARPAIHFRSIEFDIPDRTSKIPVSSVLRLVSAESIVFNKCTDANFNISDLAEMRTKRITFIQYKYPLDFSHPDHPEEYPVVKLIRGVGNNHFIRDFYHAHGNFMSDEFAEVRFNAGKNCLVDENILHITSINMYNLVRNEISDAESKIKFRNDWRSLSATRIKQLCLLAREHDADSVFCNLRLDLCELVFAQATLVDRFPRI